MAMPSLACWPVFAAAAAEDMWHVYNLIREGDQVTATTFRKVSRDAAAGSESERIKLKLTVKVEAIEFDPEGMLQAVLLSG